MKKRLYRSRTDRMIWGVCGGIAEYFGIDPTIVRIIAVLLVLVDGLGILAYIILAIVVPLEKSEAATSGETIRQNVEEITGTARQVGQEIRQTFAGEGGGRESGVRRPQIIIGIIIIAVGALLLLSRFNFLWWFRWGYLWPLIIVGIGALIILAARKK